MCCLRQGKWAFGIGFPSCYVGRIHCCSIMLDMALSPSIKPTRGSSTPTLSTIHPEISLRRYGRTDTQVNPTLGSCIVIITAPSLRLKGAGKGGVDVGENVLYRYQNVGVLTNQPLWNGYQGESFLEGELSHGLTISQGLPRFDVHKRLNVNANGCVFPAGYGTGVTSSGNLAVQVP